MAANLFEVAVATELMALGFVGARLTKYFKHVLATIVDPTNAPTVES